MYKLPVKSFLTYAGFVAAAQNNCMTLWVKSERKTPPDRTENAAYPSYPLLYL